MTALHPQLQERGGLTSGHRVRSETGVLAFLPTLRQCKESGGPSSFQEARGRAGGGRVALTILL